jgi:nucleoid DNA-binding protein
MDLDGAAVSSEPVFDAEREVTEMLTGDVPEAVVEPISAPGSASRRARAFPVRPEIKVLLDVVTEALLDGESVHLPGLGSFTVQAHSARMGRNPRTGESIAIPAGSKVHFKNADGLRRRLNADA